MNVRWISDNDRAEENDDGAPKIDHLGAVALFCSNGVAIEYASNCRLRRSRQAGLLPPQAKYLCL